MSKLAWDEFQRLWLTTLYFLLQFDITDPRRPKFVKSINPPVSEGTCSRVQRGLQTSNPATCGASKRTDMTMLDERAAARLVLQRKAVSDHVLGIKPGLHPKLPDGGFLTTQVGSRICGSLLMVLLRSHIT